MDTGVKHHPKATEQGTLGTGKPVAALLLHAGAGGQAECCDGVEPALNAVKGCPKKRMTWVMPGIG